MSPTGPDVEKPPRGNRVNLEGRKKRVDIAARLREIAVEQGKRLDDPFMAEEIINNLQALREGLKPVETTPGRKSPKP